MTDNEIINEWKDEIRRAEYIDGSYCDCIDLTLIKNTLDLINRQQAEIEKLQVFKSYFDELYGTGLDIANYHLNGALESFDNFYESALQEMVGENNV